MSHDRLAHDASFHITLVRPEAHRPAEALRPLAEALVAALRRHGVTATLGTNAFVHDATNVVVGAHLLDAAVAATLPQDTIIYNTEPLDDPRNAESLAPFAMRFGVLDYHPRNQAPLAAMGNRRAVVVPPGFVPEFVRVTHAAQKDIDVLFYGQMSSHRNHVLDAMRARGHRVVWLADTYGGERDAYIGRARLVLNVHHRPHAPLELGRLVYLLCNSAAVLCESDGDDIDPGLVDGLALGSAADLPAIAATLLADDGARAALQARGAAAIRRRDFGEAVLHAVTTLRAG